MYDEWVLEERGRLQALHDEADALCHALPSPLFTRAASAELLEPPRKRLGFPRRSTRFFGREFEMTRLTEMLADPDIRLISVLGPGGAGKTRLAQEAARAAASGFDGPVCFVALADISDSRLLASVAATVLCLPPSGERSRRDQVIAHLTAPPFDSARSLLVLDNLEHLGEEGAAEVRALLEAVPLLTCLVTSRRTLNLEGEHELLLSPLPVPHASLSGPDALAADLPSVQLFADRARTSQPDFQVTTRQR